MSALLTAAEAYKVTFDAETGRRRIDLLRRAIELWSRAFSDKNLNPTQITRALGVNQIDRSRTELAAARKTLKQLEARFLVRAATD